MTLTERIIRHVQSLPEPLQAEVLDFVVFLELKTGKRAEVESDAEWSAFSLTAAMRGMEDEPAPYSLEDIREASL